MSNGFHYSETSAFTPVPYDVYDCSLPQSNGHNTMETEVIMPLCEFENRYTTQPFVDQWVASLHQPSYEPGLSFSLLAYPYIHECLGEPGFIRKRNERERMRVRNVNEGYAILRDHLPIEPTEKRLSKVETLRGAIRYIKMLEKMLHESESSMVNEEKEDELIEVDLNNNNNSVTNANENNNSSKTGSSQIDENNNDKDLNNNKIHDFTDIDRENSENEKISDTNNNKTKSNHNMNIAVNTSNKTDNSSHTNNIKNKDKNIDLDKNNNIVNKKRNLVNDDKKSHANEGEPTNIGKSFERLSKELIYSENYSRTSNDSDECTVYIDVEEA